MTQAELKITIGITCYNAADSIARAIKSAQQQDWDSLEIIIVDDCSRDNSIEQIQAAISGDSRCRLIVHPQNLGVASARNTIVHAAKGDFIAFFDDDDISVSHRIRTQYLKLKEYEEKIENGIFICFSGVRRIYPNGYAPVFPAIGSKEKIPVGQDLVYYHLYMDRDPNVYYGSGTPCLTFMARTKVVRRAGGFDPLLRRNEDAEFAIRVGLLGGGAIGCDEVLVEQTSTGGEDKRPEASLESDLYIIDKYKNLLIQYHRYEYAKLWATMKYSHHAGNWPKAIACLSFLVITHPIICMKQLYNRAPARLIHEWKFSRKSNNGRAL